MVRKRQEAVRKRWSRIGHLQEVVDVKKGQEVVRKRQEEEQERFCC